MAVVGSSTADNDVDALAVLARHKLEIWAVGDMGLDLLLAARSQPCSSRSPPGC